jgi:chemotaxis protein methyltransferase CheR
MSSSQSLEELEIELLLTAIARRFGYDFRNYSRPSLRRRVRKAVMDQKVQTISGLQEKVLHEPGALNEFLSAISVHITSLFRDPSFYVALRKDVLPLLRTYPFIRVWVAGCATGEEVYSLAILLREEGLLERSRIYATDISDRLLEQARLGVFPLERMQLYTHNYQKASGKVDFSVYYRAQGDSVIFDASLKQNIVFSQHNLVSDSAFNEFQLILCRNVMIYFDPALRERVFGLLYQSLCHLGVLGLGLRESVRFTNHASSYEIIDPDMRIYKRIK